MLENDLIYVSTDIETNGPQIGKNSILSLASAAFSPNKMLLTTFSVNLEPLEEGEENPVTMRWWERHPQAYAASRVDCKPAEQGIKEYIGWLNQLPGKPIFVGYPVVFDFSFVVYYLHRFGNENPFWYSAIDIRSLVMGAKKCSYRNADKSKWPGVWFEDKPHTHIALDDAIEQGVVFCNILNELESKF